MSSLSAISYPNLSDLSLFFVIKAAEVCHFHMNKS